MGQVTAADMDRLLQWLRTIALNGLFRLPSPIAGSDCPGADHPGQRAQRAQISQIKAAVRDARGDEQSIEAAAACPAVAPYDARPEPPA